MGIKPIRKVGIHLLLHKGAGLGVAKLRFCLALELRVAELNGDDGGKALADVITGEVGILLLEQATITCVAVDHRGECRTESLLVGATLSGVDGVGEGVDRLRIGAGPLHRHLALDHLLEVLGLEVDDVWVNDVCLLSGIDVLDVIKQATRVAVGDLTENLGAVISLRVVARHLVTLGNCGRTLVNEGDAQVLVEEGHLVETLT